MRKISLQYMLLLLMLVLPLLITQIWRYYTLYSYFSNIQIGILIFISISLNIYHNINPSTHYYKFSQQQARYHLVIRKHATTQTPVCIFPYWHGIYAPKLQWSNMFRFGNDFVDHGNLPNVFGGKTSHHWSYPYGSCLALLFQPYASPTTGCNRILSVCMY